MDIRERFGVGKKFVIGMVHCLPLPGTVGFAGDCEKIYAQAVLDARTLEESGVDAVIVENMGDGPFAVRWTPRRSRRSPLQARGCATR